MTQTADWLAVTGIGCVSGLGIGREAFERSLFDGRTAIAPIAEFETGGMHAHVAARIHGFDPSTFVSPARLRRIDRVGQLTIASGRLALDDAGVGPSDRERLTDRIGVALGTATAGLHTLVDYLDRLRNEGPTGASALDFSNTVGNAAASLSGLELGLRGTNVTLSCKEASALSALSHASTVIRAGRAQAMVTGAADDFEALYFAVHDRFGLLATDEGHGEASRPFDRRRNGIVLGNGAFSIVLEDPAAAAARQAPILATIARVAATSSRCGLHDWPDDPSELARCMSDAMAHAGVDARDVAVVFASANSTRRLDRVESEALERVFGPRGVPVVSLKGALGECSATGAAAVIAAALSLSKGIMPPTVGFEDAGEDCPVNVSNTPRPLMTKRGRVAMVNAFASGGSNFSTIVRT